MIDIENITLEQICSSQGKDSEDFVEGVKIGITIATGFIQLGQSDICSVLLHLAGDDAKQALVQSIGDLCHHNSHLHIVK